MINILVCDDDKDIVDAIEIYLSQRRRFRAVFDARRIAHEVGAPARARDERFCMQRRE